MKGSKTRTGYLMKTAGGYRARFRVNGVSVYYPIAATDRALAVKEMKGMASRLTGDKAQVIDNLRGLLARLEGGAGGRSIPVDEGWKSYLASTSRPLSGESSMSMYHTHWAAFHRWCAGAGITDLAQVDAAAVKRYVLHVEGSGITSTTARNRVIVMRMVWKYLFDGAANPWAGVRVRVTGQMLVKRPFTLDHLDLILNSAPVGEFRDLMWFLAYTGMRVGDGCSFRREDVHLDRGVLEFLPAKTGGRGIRPMAARVGIHAVLLPMLVDKLGGQKTGPLFPEMHDMYVSRRSVVFSKFGSYLRGLNFEISLRRESVARSGCTYGWHSFRHGLQSRLADAGFGGLVADQILCHKQSGSLGQHYTHISDSVLVDAINKAMPDLRKDRGVVIQIRESA